MNKNYPKCRDELTGRTFKVHRLIAPRALGRPLGPYEVIHHRDGNHRNNALSNLLVLPSQRHHVAFEFHLRRQRRGMLSLFPELLETREGYCPGSLWKALLLGDCLPTENVRDE